MLLQKTFINLALKIKYPQAIWSDKIIELLNKNNILNSIENIYDVPGGFGAIAYNMSKKIDRKYFIIDIDKNKINFAKKHISKNKMVIKQDYLENIVFNPKSLWLLINSFYLLENVNVVLDKHKSNIDYVVGLFPYTNSKNYYFFKKKYKF